MTNVRRLHWGCRRGMLELDLILLPFFENHFETLSPEEKEVFEKMLSYSDPELYQWLMGYGVPEEPMLKNLIDKIRHVGHE